MELPINTVGDAAVKLASSEENSGLKRKEKDVFVFELANDDVDISRVCRERSELDTDLVWSPDGGPHNGQTLDVPVPTTILSTMP